AAIALTIGFGTITAQAADIKPYIGAGLGLFTSDYNGGVPGKASNAVGFYINGGADFHDYIGAELRIGSVGSKKMSGAAYIKTSSKSKIDYFFSYLVKPQVPITPEASIYALIGATTAKATLSSNNGTGTATKTRMTFGAGFKYVVADQIGLGLEYVSYLSSNKATTGGGVDMPKLSGFAFNVSYNF
ncbi:MAG: porin family protein, partial [Mariprofundaceae bacterium]